jgi:hypothetical protein
MFAMIFYSVIWLNRNRNVCGVKEFSVLYITTIYGICPILELDGWNAHPKPEIPDWDGVSIHPEAKHIPIGNVFLKILHSHA